MDDSPRHDFEGKNPDTKGHIFDSIDIKVHKQAKLIREIAIRIVFIFPVGVTARGRQEDSGMLGVCYALIWLVCLFCEHLLSCVLFGM